MPRDFNIYLEDILECINKINQYISGLNFHGFSNDEKTIDAVIRNLEIIGEASRNIPNEIRNKHPEIKWRGIIGLRNILIHEYYSLTLKIIWDILNNELPVLYEQIRELLVKK
jgi:uncharacterized protein with HEPN domain